MRRHVLVVAVFVLAVGLGGCSADMEEQHPAVQTVVSVLELRRGMNADARQYLPYFADPEIADALAAQEETDVPPIPGWREVYLSSETSSDAEVVVLWEDEDGFEDWPSATLWALLQTDGSWVIVDARDASGEPPSRLYNVDD